MAVIRLSFHHPTTGALIGTLDDTQADIEFRPALFELGALQFTVSRHLAEATPELLRKGNLVAVTVPMVSSDPIWGAVLKDDETSLVNRGEQGGEKFTLKGPGLLEVLRNARLLEDWYAPVGTGRGSALGGPGEWRWRASYYGAIFTRAIEEGQHQPGTPLSLVDIDFDRDEDSDGEPWAEIGFGFTQPTGTDVLTLADVLSQGGDFYITARPVITGGNMRILVSARQELGRDLSGSLSASTVRFEKAHNILTELKRTSKHTRITHLLVRDSEGQYSTHVTPASYQSARWGYLEAAQTDDTVTIAKIAATALKATDEESDSYELEVIPGTLPADGEYLPGPEGTSGHFWPGDYATLDSGDIAQKMRVVGVGVVVDEASIDGEPKSLRIVPELSYRNTRGFSGNNPSLGEGGNPGCICLKLCRPGTPPEEEQVLLDWDWQGTGNLESTEAYTGLGQPVQDVPGHNYSGLSGSEYGALMDHTGPARNLPRTVDVGKAALLPATPGSLYRISWRSMSASSSPQTVRCNIEWFSGSFPFGAGDADSSQTISNDLLKSWSQPGTFWLQPINYVAHSEIVTVPSGATAFRLNSDGTTWMVTDIRVEDVTTAGQSPDVRDGHPDLVGTAPRAARCDHAHHVYRDRAPGTLDNWEAAGYKAGTVWLLVDDLENPSETSAAWILADEEAGTWLPWPGGGGAVGSDVPEVQHADSPSVITNDSSHNAFPDAVVLPNGNVLLNYRKASGHNSTDGKIVRKLATPAADGSLSFGSEADQVPNPGSSTDIREGGLAVIGSRVWQTYRTWNGSTTHIGYIRYSDDNAATWSSPTTISGGFTTARVPFGPVVLAPDGVTLLQAVYGRNGTSGDFASVVVRSTNDFASQSNTTVASGTIGDGSNWTEPFLLKLDTGEVLCFIREDTDDTIYMSRCLTPDGSAWTTPEPIFSGDGKPFAFQAYSGAVILVTRQDGGGESTIYHVSYDRGETWGGEELLDDTDRHAYAAMVQLGKTLHAFFGVEFSSTNSDIYADAFIDITDARYNVGRSGGTSSASGDHNHDSDYADIAHTHAGAGRWEVLMTGSGATLEPVTNDAETDWLYAEVS
jgi:hypothetical protein